MAGLLTCPSKARGVFWRWIELTSNIFRPLKKLTVSKYAPTTEITQKSIVLTPFRLLNCHIKVSGLIWSWFILNSIISRRTIQEISEQRLTVMRAEMAKINYKPNLLRCDCFIEPFSLSKSRSHLDCNIVLSIQNALKMCHHFLSMVYEDKLHCTSHVWRYECNIVIK